MKVDGIVGVDTYHQASLEGFNGFEVEQALMLGFYQWHSSSQSSYFQLIVEQEISFNLPGQTYHDLKAASAYFRGEGFIG